LFKIFAESDVNDPAFVLEILMKRKTLRLKTFSIKDLIDAMWCEALVEKVRTRERSLEKELNGIV
jgi:hypothetical protein